MLDVCTTVACSPSVGRIAVGGSNCVRILDTSGPTFQEIKADAIDLEPSQVGVVLGPGCKEGQA
jgi:hypothetical protein